MTGGGGGGGFLDVRGKHNGRDRQRKAQPGPLGPKECPNARTIGREHGIRQQKRDRPRGNRFAKWQTQDFIKKKKKNGAKSKKEGAGGESYPFEAKTKKKLWGPYLQLKRLTNGAVAGQQKKKNQETAGLAKKNNSRNSQKGGGIIRN